MKSSRSTTRATWLAPALLFGLALALRLYHLTYHSLWFDEVMSTVWAAKPVGQIWRVGLALVEDKHPPLYYLMLHGWSGLFGGSDIAVRTLGAILGAFAVLPAHGIGLRLGGRVAAVMGALFVALNPFLIWYSQEARMFMPATTFALIGLYGIVRLADDAGSGRAGLLWAAACIVFGFTAALYTYLFSAFLLPVAFVWLIIIAWRTRGNAGFARISLTGLFAPGLVGLLFLPLARSAWLVSGAESEPGKAFSGMLPPLLALMQVYTLGWPDWPQGVKQFLTGIAMILALAGLFLAPEPEPDEPLYPATRPVGGLLLAVWLALPVLAGGFLLSRDRTVFAETRYFIFIVPALCLSWGRAAGWLLTQRRAVALVAVALALTVNVVALPYLWSPENRKEAWREAAAFVESHAGPNDAILIQADYVHPAFERYFRGAQPVFYPFTDPLSSGEQIEAPLEGLAEFDAVWLVQSHADELDPHGLVTHWFAARDPLITEVFPPGIAIRGYLQNDNPDSVPQGLQSGGEAADAGVRLLGCAFQPVRLSATDDLFHPPSNWIHVRTYWTPTGSAAQLPHLPVAQLLDDSGQVWGQSLERVGNSFERNPAADWAAGEIVRADFEVNLNPATPPGVYRLSVNLRNDANETLPCGNVEITK